MLIIKLNSYSVLCPIPYWSKAVIPNAEAKTIGEAVFY